MDRLKMIDSRTCSMYKKERGKKQDSNHRQEDRYHSQKQHIGKGERGKEIEPEGTPSN